MCRSPELASNTIDEKNGHKTARTTDLQLGQVLEEGLVDGLLRQLGGQDEHGLERELPQVCIGIRESGSHLGVDLALYGGLYVATFVRSRSLLLNLMVPHHGNRPLHDFRSTSSPCQRYGDLYKLDWYLMEVL